MTKLKERTEQQIENHEMIVKLHAQYQYDHIVAMRKASQLQRELSRAEHEMHRLEKHIERIEAFCKQHNVALVSE